MLWQFSAAGYLMKILLFLLFCTVVLFSRTLSWRGNYAQAHQEARKSGKPLLVLVVRPGDPVTGEVMQNVFMNHPFLLRFEKKVVAVIVTCERAESYPVELYYTTVFPALFLVNSEDELFLKQPLFGSEITVDSLTRLLDE